MNLENEQEEIQDNAIDVKAMEHTPLNVDSGDQPEVQRKRFKYPSKTDCARGFSETDMAIPNFLLSEDHPEYMPAHLLLMHMLQTNERQ